MENYIYPLVVCEEEGKILFFNSATQQVLGEDELLGRSLPESWKEVDTPVPIPGETPDTTELVTIIWQDILWDGNVAWYGVAVPAGGGGPTPPAADELGEAQQLRSKLEESQEMAALQALPEAWRSWCVGNGPQRRGPSGTHFCDQHPPLLAFLHQQGPCF